MHVRTGPGEKKNSNISSPVIFLGVDMGVKGAPQDSVGDIMTDRLFPAAAASAGRGRGYEGRGGGGGDACQWSSFDGCLRHSAAKE